MAVYLTDDNGNLVKAAGAGASTVPSVEVDTELNAESENPVQNKVITNNFNNYVPTENVTNHTSTGSLAGISSWEENSTIPTLNTIAHWNGSYESDNNSSNLEYCKNGQIVGSQNAQTVTGKKTFTESPILKSNTIDKNSPQSNNQYNYIDFFDKNNNRLGVMGARLDANGYFGIYLQGGNEIGLGVMSNGTNTYSWTNNPATTDNSNAIATTNFVNNKLGYGVELLSVTNPAANTTYTLSQSLLNFKYVYIEWLMESAGGHVCVTMPVNEFRYHYNDDTLALLMTSDTQWFALRYVSQTSVKITNYSLCIKLRIVGLM